MTEDDYKFFYTELHNYYRLLQVEGDTIYGRKAFRLTIEMLKNNVPIESNGFMLAHNYVNIASEAMRVNETRWAEKFINDYKNLLPPDDKENAYLYNYACVYYKKASESSEKTRAKYYGLALDTLAKVKSEDFYYMTRIKSLFIRIYYELAELDMALYLINSFKSYLSKNKLIPDNLLERYMNFSNLAQKLVKIKLGLNETPLKNLKEEILDTKRLELKGWLLKKIDETEPVHQD